MSESLLESIKYGKTEIKPFISSNTWQHTVCVVVGCGGTGSRLIPLIAQHIKNHNIKIQENPRHTEYVKHKIELLLYDMDVVELKNLTRQGFLKTDIGKNKAEVQSERMSAIYGLDCKYISDKITYENLQSTVNNIANYIFFDCTDNLTARKSIEDIHNKLSRNSIIISGGNEDTYGQVLLACKNGSTYKASNLISSIKSLDQIINNPSKDYKGTFDFLPTLTSINPDIKEVKTNSCADMTLVNEQSMPVNNLVATLMYNMFYNLVSGLPFNYNLVRCNINNTFSTNFIKHPKALRDLYCKSLTGLDNSYHIINNYNKIIELTHGVKESLIEFINKYQKASIKLVEYYILTYGWKLRGDDYTDVAKLINEIREGE